MKIATIVGARPQFIKQAAVTRAIKEYNRRIQKLNKRITEVIIHTGQHYDYEMSKCFFDELAIPAPNYNLGVGSGEHGLQTGKMLIKIEEVLQRERPDLVLVYGDTNSTLAGALTAAKMHIPVAHIEAGMRSFNRDMPEEINRILTDHVSTLLFCSTRTAVNNLAREGITKGVYKAGDVMYDICLFSIKIAKEKSKILQTLNLRPKSYYLATIHRPSNTDDRNTLKSILEALSELDSSVVIPLHPRAKKAILEFTNFPIGKFNHNLIFIEPVGYLDMLILEKSAKKILTDSGGVQKEAYFLEVPCITLREETEWVETVASGWNVLVGANKEKIIESANCLMPERNTDSFFGNSQSSKKICRYIVDYMGNSH